MKVRVYNNKHSRICTLCKCFNASHEGHAPASYGVYSLRRDYGWQYNLVCKKHFPDIANTAVRMRVIPLRPRTLFEALEYMNAMVNTPNLVEIVMGNRVGIPTLSLDNQLERAAGILSKKPVSWITSNT